jgi:hypothetical protein
VVASGARSREHENVSGAETEDTEPILGKLPAGEAQWPNSGRMITKLQDEQAIKANWSIVHHVGKSFITLNSPRHACAIVRGAEVYKQYFLREQHGDWHCEMVQR